MRFWDIRGSDWHLDAGLSGVGGPCPSVEARLEMAAHTIPGTHEEGVLLPESACRERGFYGAPIPFLTCSQIMAPCLSGESQLF